MNVIYSQGGSASENIAYACCTCRVAEQRDSSITIMITPTIMMMMMMMLVMASLMLRHDGHLLWLIALKPHDLPLKRDTFLRHFRFPFATATKTRIMHESQTSEHTHAQTHTHVKHTRTANCCHNIMNITCNPDRHAAWQEGE